MVHQRDRAARVRHLAQQRLDELEQVVDLLELAAAVLVHLAVARQDVECLEQLDGLAGTDFVTIGHGRQDLRRGHRRATVYRNPAPRTAIPRFPGLSARVIPHFCGLKFTPPAAVDQRSTTSRVGGSKR
ncbi:hypothetical protein D3C72_1920360 [compost metagenome]